MKKLEVVVHIASAHVSGDEMVCEGEDIMAQEASFTAALTSMSSYTKAAH